MQNRVVQWALTGAAVVLVCSSASSAGIDASSPNMPPTGGVYYGIQMSWTAFGTTYYLNNPAHHDFSSSNPPPALGNSDTHIITESVVEGDLAVGAIDYQHIWGFAQPTALHFNHVSDVLNVSYFDTEMLALDINSMSGPLSGPITGLRLRESPTLPSLGQTVITNNGGGLYHIDSFFDVFTELSLDGGQTWIPSNGPTRMTLFPAPGAAALLGMGGLMVSRRRRR